MFVLNSNDNHGLTDSKYHMTMIVISVIEVQRELCSYRYLYDKELSNLML